METVAEIQLQQEKTRSVRIDPAHESPARLAYITHLPITQWLFLDGQNRFLAEQGFELHALSSPGERLDDLAKRDNLRAHGIPIAREIAPIRDFVSLVRLYFALRRIRPDIVHLSTPKGALLGALAARLANIKSRVFLIRGLTSARSSGFRRYFYQRLERLTVKLATSTICNAPSLLDYGRKEGILGPSEGTVLLKGMSNGVNLSRHDPAAAKPADIAAICPAAADPRTQVIGFVGRLAFDKGVEVLCDAWQAIRNEYPHALLMLVGPWETKDEVREDVRRSFAEDPRVILTDAVDDVAPYYKRMSVFVLPSFGEGFPNSAMEAAAYGLPVITTETPGCADAVKPDVTGIRIPPRDADALAAAIRTYLDDEQLRRRHGDAGRRRVLEDFQQEPIWNAYRDFYLSMLKKNGEQTNGRGV